MYTPVVLEATTSYMLYVPSVVVVAVYSTPLIVIVTSASTIALPFSSSKLPVIVTTSPTSTSLILASVRVVSNFSTLSEVVVSDAWCVLLLS
ncbi:MAG: hypothetical protein LUG89_02795 [Methanosphaera sp.]|nr:hypothetical protein [Methanosphaera sp.]